MGAVEDRLAEIEALADGASVGPWTGFLDSETDLGFGPVYEALVSDGNGDPIIDWGSGVVVSDAAFIAASRTLVPALVNVARDVLAYADRCDVVGRAGHEDDDLKATHRQVAEELRAMVTAALVVTP